MATSAMEVPASGRRFPSIGRIAAWAAMIFAILAVAIPFYWMVRTALSTNREIYANPIRYCRSASPCKTSRACWG